jgi:hypothetical protein
MQNKALHTATIVLSRTVYGLEYQFRYERKKIDSFVQEMYDRIFGYFILSRFFVTSL